jgi:glycosyltransferase involved in cell wall biosynthesis
MNPKLSIITINLNNIGGLKKTIESVIFQKIQYLKYIVIDGGSTYEVQNSSNLLFNINLRNMSNKKIVNPFNPEKNEYSINYRISRFSRK